MSIKSATDVNNKAGDSQGGLGSSFQNAIGKNPHAIIDSLNQKYASSGDALDVLRAAAQFYKDTQDGQYNNFAQDFYNNTIKPNHEDDKDAALVILGRLKRGQ